jgi:hypothetical protein
MDRESIDLGSGVVGELLSRLCPQDRFCLILAGPQPRVVGSGWLAPTDKNRAMALRAMRETSPSVPGDLAGALRAVLELLPDDSDRRQGLVMLTDGLDQIQGLSPREQSNLTRRLVERMKVHVIQYGDSSRTLYDLAAATGGGFAWVTPARGNMWGKMPAFEACMQVLQAVLQRDRAPLVRAASAEGLPEDLAASVVLADGNTAWVALPGLGRDVQTLELTLTVDQRARKVRLRRPKDSGGRLLDRIAAEVVVSDLVDRMRASGGKVEMMHRAVEFSRRQSVVTEATCMLGFESLQQYVDLGLAARAGGPAPPPPDASQRESLKKLRRIVDARKDQPDEIDRLIHTAARFDVELTDQALQRREPTATLSALGSIGAPGRAACQRTPWNCPPAHRVGSRSNFRRPNRPRIRTRWPA